MGKPPLGVAPKWIRQEQRLEELSEAVIRYRQDALPIPDEWFEEIRDLADALLVQSRHRALLGRLRLTH